MHLSVLDRHLPERGVSRLSNVFRHLHNIEHTLTKTWRTDKAPQNLQPVKSTTVTEIKCPSAQSIEYPQASFLGLPVELRLQIYSQLAESVHFHIDCGYGQSLKGRKRRLCNAPDAKFRQICTRPDFSGLHPSDDRCYVQSRNATSGDPFALRATCRLTYHETQGLLDKREVGFTVENSVAAPFLRSLENKQQASLTRLTIIHANYSTCNYGGIQPAVAFFRSNAQSFTSLRTLAIQTTQAHYKFCVKQPPLAPRFAPEQSWQKLWFIKALSEAFEGRVTIVLEAWIVVRAGYKENTSDKDEVVIVRGVTWGEKERLQHGEDEVEVVRKDIVEEHENAPWKVWWKDDWLGYGRRPC